MISAIEAIMNSTGHAPGLVTQKNINRISSSILSDSFAFGSILLA